MPEALLEQFVRQTSDHLAQLEPYLLELEVAGEDANSELLGRIFRVLHSIRGGASLLGVDDVRNLTRLLENVITLVRNGSIAVSQDVVRNILRSCDMIQALVHGDASPMLGQMMDTLSGIARASLAEPDQLDAIHSITIANGNPILHISDYELEQSKSGDVYLYVLVFDLCKDVTAKDITPLDLLEYLQKSGHVLGTYCAGVVAEDTICDCTTRAARLYVLFSTILEIDLVNAVFMIDASQIHQVDVQAFSEGDGSWELNEFVSDAICDGEVEPVADVPIEGVDELMAEYDRTMLKMQEAARVPFEPWEEYDGQISHLQINSESYDAMMNGLSLGYSAAPAMVKERGVFDDLAPVDDILEGYDADELPAPDDGVFLSGDEDLFVDAGPVSLPRVTSNVTQDVTSNVPNITQDVTSYVSNFMPDDVLADWETSDEDTAVSGNILQASLASDGNKSGIAAADDVMDFLEGTSESEQLDALELEFEAALMAEAQATGIILPQVDGADTMFAPDAADRSGDEALLPVNDNSAFLSGTDADVEESAMDPDADLFADSGIAPDMSYLSVPERDATDTGGIMLTLEDSVDMIHGFPVVAGMGEACLQLTGDLTIANSGRVREALLDLMQQYSKVELDMRETEALDMTFIQILLAARKSAMGRGVSLVVHKGVTDVTRQVFRQCGLDKEVQERLGLSSLFVD